MLAFLMRDAVATSASSRYALAAAPNAIPAAHQLCLIKLSAAERGLWGVVGGQVLAIVSVGRVAVELTPECRECF